MKYLCKTITLVYCPTYMYVVVQRCNTNLALDIKNAHIVQLYTIA